mgnify:CR=1 FL=1|tara:strand:- start:34 stop:249 length:216 start_codon:yes stop_codon:yes gene_type:complete
MNDIIIELDCDDEEYLTSQLDRLKDLSQWACSENQTDIKVVTDALIGTITTRLSQWRGASWQYQHNFLNET